jgi:hypothetical protein
VTVPFGAPAPRDVWTFNYSGFFAAGVRGSIRNRGLENVSLAPRQSDLVLRNSVETGGSCTDPQSCFNAGSTLGSWVEMKFEYGNRNVTAHVNLTTWNPSRGASFTQLGSQNFIDAAFLTARLPPIGKLRLGFSIGAFTVIYGNLGNYGGGFYSNAVGSVAGIGETTALEYDLTDRLVLQLDHGFHSSGDKAPGGGNAPIRPVAADESLRQDELQRRANAVAPQSLGDSYDPAAWTHHVHLALLRNGDVSLRGQLHYMNNFSYDERGYLPPAETPAQGQSESNYNPDPRPETPYVDESVRRNNGRFDAYGATFGFKGTWFQGGLGLVHGRADNAYALHGLRVSYVGDGENFSNVWLGPRSVSARGAWRGSMWSTAGEAEFSWGTLARAPKPFWGEGWNVTTAVGFQYGRIESEDPAREGWSMYRAGLDVIAHILPWLGAEFRADRVSPNTRRPDQAYFALMTRAIFRTYWSSRESVSLQYNKWIYGSESPVNFVAPPVEELDSDVVSAGFGMWW